MEYYKQQIVPGGPHFVFHTESGKSIPYNSGKLSEDMKIWLEEDILDLVWIPYALMSRRKRTKIPTICTSNIPCPLKCKAKAPLPCPINMWGDVLQSVPVQPKKEEEMTISIEQQTLDFLNNELRSAYHRKADQAYTDFHIHDMTPPRDEKEFAQRIKDGLFEIAEKTPNGYWSWDRAIRWRDPDHKADQEGVETAQKLIEEAYKAAKRIVMVKTGDEGLDAIAAFEQEDFGPKALKKKS